MGSGNDDVFTGNMDHLAFDARHEIEHAVANGMQTAPRGVVRLRATQPVRDRVAARPLLLAQSFSEHVETHRRRLALVMNAQQ